eukprot:TRINITY_DN4105_c0_g2_i1.p1 TRINITY_DN4105_c0_g2~~TRINITY_DN4105_c0_g2_i1.p1  ORF type:complete len:162 (+),score=15.16 TRINITY_DN4105_c0_g2_i1:246-731(+)
MAAFTHLGKTAVSSSVDLTTPCAECAAARLCDDPALANNEAGLRTCFSSHGGPDMDPEECASQVDEGCRRVFTVLSNAAVAHSSPHHHEVPVLFLRCHVVPLSQQVAAAAASPMATAHGAAMHSSDSSASRGRCAQDSLEGIHPTAAATGSSVCRKPPQHT